MIYDIFHPIDGSMNDIKKDRAIPFKQVARVEAKTLDNAYFKAQNDFNPEYRAFEVRSTSVGDLIHREVKGNHEFWMVTGVGFEFIQNPNVHWRIDWEKERQDRINGYI